MIVELAIAVACGFVAGRWRRRQRRAPAPRAVGLLAEPLDDALPRRPYEYRPAGRLG